MNNHEGLTRIQQADALVAEGKVSHAFSMLQDVVLDCADPIKGLAALKAAEIYMQEIVEYRTDADRLKSIEVMLKVAMQSSDDEVADIARSHLEVLRRKFPEFFSEG